MIELLAPRQEACVHKAKLGIGVMRRHLFFLALAIAGMALAAPLTVAAQALPDEVRAAGVTVVAWNTVQTRWRQVSLEKHVSEKALASVCTKMGVTLAKGGHLDLKQLIGLIDSRADELNALNQQLTRLAQTNGAATGGLLQQARAAIDAGDLDQADTLLEQARKSAKASRENAQRREAEVIAAEGQVKSLRLDYLGAAADYAEAADILPTSDTHGRWTYVIDQAGALQERGKLFDEPQPLRDAVGLYRGATLVLVPRATSPSDWAATQTNLGNALATLGDRGDDQALKDAITAYRSALEVRARDRDPAGWAATQNALGTALWRLGARGDDQALKDAITVFRSALEVRARDRDPAGWAATQNNLGLALETLGERGDDKALKGAITAYRSALEVYTRDRDPADWAQTENNLAIALATLGDRGDVQALKDAITAYRSALEVRTRDRDPAGWAQTQANLGNPLETLGERGDDQALKDAITAYRSALEVFTRDRDPAGWAATQSNLGTALATLGERGDVQALRDAITAYRSALEVFTRDRDPAGWAVTQTNLGNALETLGERGDVQALKDAVAAYRSALEIWTPATYPAYAKIGAFRLSRAEAMLAKRQH